MERLLVALMAFMEAVLAERELTHEPREADAKLRAFLDEVKGHLGVESVDEAMAVYARPSDALDDAKEIHVVSEPETTADVHPIEQEGGPIGM